MSETPKLAIMIVDDRPENLTSLKQLLARDDLEILTAESGNQALSMMLETDLALVLLDVQMPGMDGFEVAELMRRNDRTRSIPIIFVTAINKERRHIFSGFEAGAVDYMFKPVDPFIIRSKVNVFLDIKLNELAREQLVTELDEANQQLHEISDRKSDFLSAASHELRTPLTVIKEYCGLVYDGIVGETNAEQRKCMEAALRNCNRLADLVNDLLDLDCIESGHRAFLRKAVDVNQVLQDSLEDFLPRCAAVGQTIRLDKADNLPAALGDVQMITQVMVNLIGNAHKFIPSGGEIIIRGLTVEDGVRIEIEDTGPGIDLKDQDKVFEKFTQLNRKDGPGPKGTGLGLAISHKIIELLDGELGLESEAGKGTTFHFTIPKYETSAQMRALISDGANRGYSSHLEWSLILLRPEQDQDSLPEWLDDLVVELVQRDGDLATDTEIRGAAVKAIMLQAPADGALAFLARMFETLNHSSSAGEKVQFSLQKITRETRSNFEWKPDELEFTDLAFAQDVKGLTHV